MATLKFLNETVQTESNDEAESLMNIYIASNLNENTFHMEPNEANFFSEQFEYQYKNKVNFLFFFILDSAFIIKCIIITKPIVYNIFNNF